MKLPDYITEFIQKLKKKSFDIYVVGGSVRDLLLNHPITNWDFTTNAKPEEIQKIFPQSFYYNTYGTVSIPFKDANNKMIFEITPFRKENTYTDFRHPSQIEWATTVEEDLARRDFTINAMAFNGEKLIDLYKGAEDLSLRVIRSVGDPQKRFSEDALRLMRAVRFASELGFVIEKKTEDAIRTNAHLISNVSWERIRDELLKIIASPHPDEGIIILKNSGLLKYILPELDLCFSVQQISPKRHHIYDVGIHSVMALKYCPSLDPITRLATLLHDVGKAQTYRKDPKTQIITFYNHEVVGTRIVTSIVDRLKLSNKQKEKLIQLVKYHQFTVSELQTDKAVRRFIRELGKEYIQDMLDLRTGDRVGSGATPTSWRFELFKKRIVEVQKKPFTVADLHISGDDIMKILFLKPGPKVGEILKNIFDEVVENKIKNEKKLLLKRLSHFKEK